MNTSADRLLRNLAMPTGSLQVTSTVFDLDLLISGLVTSQWVGNVSPDRLNCSLSVSDGSAVRGSLRAAASPAPQRL